MNMIETTIARISQHELDTGKPPTYLKMKDGAFDRLVAEICIEKKLGRNATRLAVRTTNAVKILDVKIIREGSEKLPETIRLIPPNEKPRE